MQTSQGEVQTVKLTPRRLQEHSSSLQQQNNEENYLFDLWVLLTLQVVLNSLSLLSHADLRHHAMPLIDPGTVRG